MATVEEILIADDQESIRLALQRGLEKRGYRVDTATDGSEALAKALDRPYGLIFLDIKMPGMSGLEILEKIKEPLPDTPVIIITGHGSMSNAINAMKKGAYDYIVKPFNMEQIYLKTEKSFSDRSLKKKLAAYKAVAGAGHQEDEIVGKSMAMQEVFLDIGKVADTDATVLILGESGTGKEMVARAVHQNSKRSANPFIAVNCAAIPKDLLESELFGFEKGAFTGAMASKLGKFELADGGTIFLDEVGDLDISMQTKVLRVLQEREIDRVGGNTSIAVDVRIISATDRDLEQAMHDNLFRESLFYRLNVFQIKLPPLRKRKEDIPLLIDFFLARFISESGLKNKYLTPQVYDLLQEYQWPGNVRELENMLKRSILISTGASITPEYFPDSISGKGSPSTKDDLPFEGIIGEKFKDFIIKMCRAGQGDLYRTVVEQIERPLLESVLAECKGNQLKAAGLLGINRNTLRKKMQALQIKIQKE
jgi:two-component system nitrogen regulation response regulator GlnG